MQRYIALPATHASHSNQPPKMVRFAVREPLARTVPRGQTTVFSYLTAQPSRDLVVAAHLA
jgi:hypothetical protein